MTTPLSPICPECAEPMRFTSSSQDVPSPELSNFGHRTTVYICKNDHTKSVVEEVIYE